MKYDIESLKRKMLVKYPFFGSVVASVDYKVSIDIPTAGTDGKTIYYNPNYLEGLSVEGQTFVFAHEVCHIAFNHILRSEGKDSYLWNIATDGVINQFLKRDGLKIVDGGVNIEDAINYDAEKLYEKLLQEKKKKEEQQSSKSQSQGKKQSQQQSTGSSQGQEQQQNNQQQTGNKEQNSQDKKQSQSEEQSGDGSGVDSQEEKEKQDIGHDTHSMWEKAVKDHKKEQKQTELGKQQKKLEEMGEKQAFKKNLEDKKKQLEELKKALSKQVSQAGTTTNSKIRTVDNIGVSKPIVDWRYILKEAITYDVDWSYQNATIEDGVVVPHLENQPMPETEIVLDTSGSIDEVLLKNFLRECKNILQHTKLRVGCFDTKFYGFHEIRTEEDIEDMRFEGGGGTNFDVAVGAFTRRVENKIIFTDGEASMPSMPLDAIWIVFGGRRINPKGGKVIQITQEQLGRLYSFENEPKGRSR